MRVLSREVMLVTTAPTRCRGRLLGPSAAEAAIAEFAAVWAKPSLPVSRHERNMPLLGRDSHFLDADAEGNHMLDLDELNDIVTELERAVAAGDYGAIVDVTRRLRILILEAEVAAFC